MAAVEWPPPANGGNANPRQQQQQQQQLTSRRRGTSESALVTLDNSSNDDERSICWLKLHQQSQLPERKASMISSVGPRSTQLGYTPFKSSTLRRGESTSLHHNNKSGAGSATTTTYSNSSGDEMGGGVGHHPRSILKQTANMPTAASGIDLSSVATTISPPSVPATPRPHTVGRSMSSMTGTTSAHHHWKQHFQQQLQQQQQQQQQQQSLPPALPTRNFSSHTLGRSTSRATSDVVMHSATCNDSQAVNLLAQPNARYQTYCTLPRPEQLEALRQQQPLFQSAVYQPAAPIPPPPPPPSVPIHQYQTLDAAALAYYHQQMSAIYGADPGAPPVPHTPMVARSAMLPPPPPAASIERQQQQQQPQQQHAMYSPPPALFSTTMTASSAHGADGCQSATSGAGLVNWPRVLHLATWLVLLGMALIGIGVARVWWGARWILCAEALHGLVVLVAGLLAVWASWDGKQVAAPRSAARHTAAVLSCLMTAMSLPFATVPFLLGLMPVAAWLLPALDWQFLVAEAEPLELDTALVLFVAGQVAVACAVLIEAARIVGALLTRVEAIGLPSSARGGCRHSTTNSEAGESLIQKQPL